VRQTNKTEQILFYLKSRIILPAITGSLQFNFNKFNVPKIDWNTMINKTLIKIRQKKVAMLNFSRIIGITPGSLRKTLFHSYVFPLLFEKRDDLDVRKKG